MKGCPVKLWKLILQIGNFLYQDSRCICLLLIDVCKHIIHLFGLLIIYICRYNTYLAAEKLKLQIRVSTHIYQTNMTTSLCGQLLHISVTNLKAYLSKATPVLSRATMWIVLLTNTHMLGTSLVKFVFLKSTPSIRL